jgi:hypothetical protein
LHNDVRGFFCVNQPHIRRFGEDDWTSELVVLHDMPQIPNGVFRAQRVKSGVSHAHPSSYQIQARE